MGNEGYFFILFFVVALVTIFRSVIQGKIPKIRRIQGLDYIEEAVDRAVELGGSIQYTSGEGGLSLIS